MYRFLTLILCLLWTATAQAQSIAPRAGWVIIATGKQHAALLNDLKKAVQAHKMGVVTQAGPTGAASARGISIPENRIVGVFNNDFAVRTLSLSTAAMIEAPIRFYVTEETDGTATLSYKTPSFVFAPYLDEGGVALQAIASELDLTFDKIATSATQ